MKIVKTNGKIFVVTEEQLKAIWLPFKSLFSVKEFKAHLDLILGIMNDETEISLHHINNKYTEYYLKKSTNELIEDLGMRHLYIKPRTPRLNGKVERSHGSDKTEFYLLISYTNDVDLQAKLSEWEMFYNGHRLHGGLKGQTPYEVLKQKLFIHNDNNLKVNNL